MANLLEALMRRFAGEQPTSTLGRDTKIRLGKPDPTIAKDSYFQKRGIPPPPQEPSLFRAYKPKWPGMFADSLGSAAQAAGESGDSELDRLLFDRWIRASNARRK
jgi:hypothetical protein